MARKSRKAAASVAAVPAAPAAKVWRCAVYARLSCRNNGLAGDSSLRAQVDFVRDSLSGMEGVEVVGVYEDNGRTGTTFEGRAAFDALLASDVAFEEAVAALEDLFTFSRDLVLALVRRIEVGRDGGIVIEFRFGDWRDRVASIERRLA